MQQVIMQPNTALWHWREGRMTIEQVLSQTDFKSFAELYEAATDALGDEAAAREMWGSTPEQEEEEEIVALIWDLYSEYLKEQSPEHRAGWIPMAANIIKKERQKLATSAVRASGFCRRQ